MSKNFNQKSLKFILLLFFVFLVQQQSFLSAQNLVTESLATTQSAFADETLVDSFTTNAEPKINKNFFINLLINLTAVFFILFFIYYPNYQKRDKIFTFLMFNVVIYLLTFVLNEVKISMGAAFGLFAVFSMLRYRTTSIDIKDMTYLFIFIALGLVSAIQFAYYELIIISAIIFIAVLLLDTNVFFRKEMSSTLLFERIEMIKPESRDELVELLKVRTGINIHRIEISEINFLKDTALITFFYYTDKKKK